MKSRRLKHFEALEGKSLQKEIYDETNQLTTDG